MNPQEFFNLVEEMRMQQKKYFSTRNTETLQKAKKLEWQIDEEITRVRAILTRPQPQQLNLFDIKSDSTNRDNNHDQNKS